MSAIMNPNIIVADLPMVPKVVTIHGVLLGLAFVIFYPMGSVIIRASKSKYTLLMHVVCQVLGLILMLGGLGSGIRVAKIIDKLHNNPHTILGTVVIAALILQPIFGYVHHRKYVATQGPSVWTTIHVWYGRVLIALGIINGGFGLKLASGTPAYSKAGTIAYAILAAAGGIALIGAMTLAIMNKRKAANSEKQHHNDSS